LSAKGGEMPSANWQKKIQIISLILSLHITAKSLKDEKHFGHQLIRLKQLADEIDRHKGRDILLDILKEDIQVPEVKRGR